MVYTICRAIFLYEKRKDIWLKLMERGMEEDFSWERSAKQYVNLYEKLLRWGE
jgi:starch synthase